MNTEFLLMGFALNALSLLGWMLLGIFVAFAMVLLYQFFAFLMGPAPVAPIEAVPEAPHIPAPIIVHLAIGDREMGRASYDKDFETRRFEWAAWAEAQELIRDVEEGV
jgi:hypothetical protein